MFGWPGARTWSDMGRGRGLPKLCGAKDGGAQAPHGCA
ncbi:hypothetical protein D777_00094 [Marinobacter nitratireducens]|uniref:Uncharacterized protein n=1 Tax=Marinobacter nitratireducens TaxID=1137280 RepID=A0A072N6F9_9GAMM|nr:hypothetical protein D777_00094 [Marinobacter nitratireducens]